MDQRNKTQISLKLLLYVIRLIPKIQDQVYFLDPKLWRDVESHLKTLDLVQGE